MKKTILIVWALIAAVKAQTQQAGTPEARIKELGIRLIEPSAPVANYVKAVRVGNVLYLSGHGPDKPEGGVIKGKVGKELSTEQAKEAARVTGISLLSTLKATIGDLKNVERIVKLTGMVNAIPEFEQHPQVINGCSDLMVEVFGDRGKHARTSVGVGSLPNNIPVEIEMIVEIKK